MLLMEEENRGSPKSGGQISASLSIVPGGSAALASDVASDVASGDVRIDNGTDIVADLDVARHRVPGLDQFLLRMHAIESK